MSEAVASFPSPLASGASHSSSAPKTRRRNRIITSCLECRRRKLKCDRLHPCNHCARANRDCIFLAPARDPAAKGKLNQFKESIETLEKELEAVVEGGSASGWSVTSRDTNAPTSQPNTFDDRSIPENERHLEPTPLAVVDVAYDDDAEDILDDVGVRVGRMRITERIGGFVRPNFGEELALGLNRHSSSDSAYSSPFSPMASPGSTESVAEYLAPSSEYLVPSSSLVFSTNSPEDLSFIDFLPSRDLTDRLLHQYWTSVHPLAHTVHRPSFERQYLMFWQSISAGFEPISSLQAIVFAVLFSAAASVDRASAHADLGFTKTEIVRMLQAGCEHALCRANILRTTKIETIQALVTYLIPMCRDEVSRAHAALTSLAIRLATMAGLHRDGTTYGLSPVDVHIRRLIWHHLIFLDDRTTEVVGPPLQIRKEDQDTRLPLDVDDSDFESSTPPEKDADRWTDMTLTRIHLECDDVSRWISTEWPRVQRKQTTITALLRNIEEFRQRLENRCLPNIDETVPIQALGAKLIRLHVYKMHIIVLNRYTASAPQEIPERLRQIVWASGTAMMEIAIDIETSLRFKPWAWYSRAYQQFAVALLLVFEVHYHPERREADRIWACLDYIFDAPKYMSRADKVNHVMSVAIVRLEEYKKLRKRKVPLTMQQNLSATSMRKSSSDAHSAPQTDSGNSGSSVRLELPGSKSASASMARNRAGRSTSDAGSPAYPKYSSTGNDQGQRQVSGVPQPSLAYAANSSFAEVSGVGNAMQNLNFASMENIQPSFDEMDWDEIDRLFPLDDPTLDLSPMNFGDATDRFKDFECQTVPKAEPDLNSFSLPYYNYFTPEVSKR